jgi:hypothetical protein
VGWVQQLNNDKHDPAPVSLPTIRLPAIDADAEAIERKEAAQKFAEARLIKAGATAWTNIARAESFNNWLAIGKALLLIRKVALAQSGANRAMGRIYSKSFNAIAKQHFIGMKASTRSVSIELAEHADQITSWRDSLPERQKRRLVHPLSVTRRWKASLNHGNGKCPQDLKRDAVAAWRRFVSCVELLPPDQAAPIWQAVSAEVAAMAHL